MIKFKSFLISVLYNRYWLEFCACGRRHILYLPKQQRNTKLKIKKLNKVSLLTSYNCELRFSQLIITCLHRFIDSGKQKRKCVHSHVIPSCNAHTKKTVFPFLFSRKQKKFITIFGVIRLNVRKVNIQIKAKQT